MSAFEDFVNVELPRRPVMITSEISGGYDGDPNISSEPIINGAPKGAYFLQDSTGDLWHKKTTSSSSWALVATGASGSTILGTTTTGTISVIVDYTNGQDPVSGTVWRNQTDVNNFLTAESVPGVKTFNGLMDVLPFNILHDLTITFTADNHRPRVGDAISFNFTNRFIGAEVNINGPTPDTWPAVDPSLVGLTIDVSTPFTAEPTFDFGTSHPGLIAGFDLVGSFAVVDDAFVGGYIAIPVVAQAGDVVTLAYPGFSLVTPTCTFAVSSDAVMQNTTDGATAASNEFFLFANVEQSNTARVTLRRITVEPFTGVSGAANMMTLKDSLMVLEELFINGDKDNVDTNALRITNGAFAFLVRSVSPGNGNNSDFFAQVSNSGSGLQLFWTLLTEWENGISITDSSSFRCGSMHWIANAEGGSQQKRLIGAYASECSVERAFPTFTGENTFRNVNADVVCWSMDGHAHTFNYTVSTFPSIAVLGAKFYNCAGPLIQLGSHIRLDMRDPDSAINDGGSNSGPVFKILGSHSVLLYDQAKIAVTAGNFVEFQDGTSIATKTTLGAAATQSDDLFNVVKRLT